jgi:hypothetical protein
MAESANIAENANIAESANIAERSQYRQNFRQKYLHRSLIISDNDK